MFDRQFLTRLLCIVALLSWLVFLGLFTALLYVLVARVDLSRSEIDRLLYAGFYTGLFSGVVRGVLWLWPHCDRCQRPLFKEGRRRPLTTQKPWEKQAFDTLYEPERDFRAKTLLGAFSTRAIVDSAINGAARCQWCGHMDGEPPEYRATIAP